MATATGKTIAEVAKDLGIDETTLASWVSWTRRAEVPPRGPAPKVCGVATLVADHGRGGGAR
ncbi:hypothetical protein [Streptomyces sp. TP-A0356]|uniref:hypothetical protein n=1 Tax=Streptomyces sp. TP-A0356 TaxID=1359208 RepID=UPI00099ECC08|nr:hypothetical protein [Streptomyces sp. TP-A0356]